MASSGIEVDRSITGGVAALKIHGGAYHSLGDLHPQPNRQAVFAQLVVFDGVEQHMAAYGTKAGLDALLGELRRMLQGTNVGVQQFQRTASGGQQADLHMHISPEGALFSHALLCEHAAVIVCCRDLWGDELFRHAVESMHESSGARKRDLL